jgi:1-acyl-sn-glycerol-3-phosphate acyltransferase
MVHCSAMKPFFRFLLRVLFRFRAYDMDGLRTPGPVLLIPNHLSWIDWLFLWVCVDEDWKFVTSSISAQTSWVHRKLMINHYTLPIDTGSPYAVKRMAEFLIHLSARRSLRKPRPSQDATGLEMSCFPMFDPYHIRQVCQASSPVGMKPMTRKTDS